MVITKGEVWKITDRHGSMTICLCEDVDESKDMFFDAMILKGRKQFISKLYNELQAEQGKGSWEEISKFRTGICHFDKRLTELEKRQGGKKK